MFQLTKEDCLRSQIVTLNEGRGKHLKYLPEDFAITYDYGTNQFLRLLTDTDRQLMRTLTLEFGGCE